MNESKVLDAIETILSDKKSYPTSLNYAVSYCKAGLLMSGHELAVQCIYIVSNIHHWKHPLAKEVRTTLRQFAKEN
jgi:hypothetical protein